MIMYSIQQFSDRTGLSPTTLRYYESEGLLIPRNRRHNGYREYSEEQVNVARLISSLRQAGVRMSDIEKFLNADHDEREALLERWRNDAAARLLSVQVANQYLNGISSRASNFHLIYWEQPVQMIWAPFTVPNEKLFLKEKMKELQIELQRANCSVSHYGFIKTHNIVDSYILGEIGFQLKTLKSFNLTKTINDTGMRVETFEPTLFISMDIHPSMQYACKTIYAAIQKFGFHPMGQHLERHTLEEDSSIVVMIPVVHYKSE
jgi:DNA-binding transcriptional MerR regulator